MKMLQVIGQYGRCFFKGCFVKLQTSRHYVIFILLVIIFSLPGLSAYLYYHHPDWLTPMKTNQGVLFSPSVKLPSLEAGQSWHLLLWYPTACGTPCMQVLDKLGRIRLALGRRLYDLDLTLLLSPHAERVSTAQMDSLHQQAMDVITLTARDVALLTPNEARILIADPRGYLVLSYPAGSAPEPIYHDLKQLIK